MKRNFICNSIASVSRPMQNASILPGSCNLFARRLTKQSSSSGKSPDLSFDGQTAIITGGARGLGYEYATLLASRGANVILNDAGGSRSGGEDDGESNGRPVVELAAENILRQTGRRVFANQDSVCDPVGAKRLVDSAVRRFGGVDILINNAGILRDRSFAKMSIEDWDQVHNVHLRGSFLVTHACWPHMQRQKYGRIIMTGSTSGLYGNFGQANYAAAKMGLIGLSNTLAIEGAKSHIHSNVIVPMAASRMTRDIMPEEFVKHLEPSYVAPLVVWLCHKSCQQTGAIWEAAGQWYGRHRLVRSRGKYLPGILGPRSLEKIVENLNEISGPKPELSKVDSFTSHLDALLTTFEKENQQ